MDVIEVLPEYLDFGIGQEEMRQIALTALAQRIREIKLSVAQAVVQARACTLVDNLEGRDTALEQARRLQGEYHEFHAQWRRLEGGEGGGNTSSHGAESQTDGETHVDRRENRADAVAVEDQR